MQVHDQRDVHLACEPFQLLHDDLRSAGIERGARLVTEDHPGVLDQSPGDADPLFLSAAQAVATLIDVVGKTQHRDQLHGLPFFVAAVPAECAGQRGLGAEPAAMHCNCSRKVGR